MDMQDASQTQQPSQDLQFSSQKSKLPYTLAAIIAIIAIIAIMFYTSGNPNNPHTTTNHTNTISQSTISSTTTSQNLGLDASHGNFAEPSASSFPNITAYDNVHAITMGSYYTTDIGYIIVGNNASNWMLMPNNSGFYEFGKYFNRSSFHPGTSIVAEGSGTGASILVSGYDSQDVLAAGSQFIQDLEQAHAKSPCGGLVFGGVPILNTEGQVLLPIASGETLTDFDVSYDISSTIYNISAEEKINCRPGGPGMSSLTTTVPTTQTTSVTSSISSATTSISSTTTLIQQAKSYAVTCTKGPQYGFVSGKCNSPTYAPDTLTLTVARNASEFPYNAPWTNVSFVFTNQSHCCMNPFILFQGKNATYEYHLPVMAANLTYTITIPTGLSVSAENPTKGLVFVEYNYSGNYFGLGNANYGPDVSTFAGVNITPT